MDTIERTRPRFGILVPVLFAIHNAEEAWTFPQLMAHPERLGPLATLVPSIDRMRAALLIVTVVAFVLLAFRNRWPLLVAQAAIAANVVSHLASAALLGTYTPGLVTAVLLNVPFSVAFFGAARRDGLLRPGDGRRLILAGLVLSGPLLALGIALLGT